MALNNPTSDKKIVLLVGGVGGAKLAYGLYHSHPPQNLTIIVNTGDDMWHYGLRVCPDIDTVLYTLADRVDTAQGWGLADDTTLTLDALRQLDETPWFRLGDKDLATHLVRTQRLREGQSLTNVVNHLRHVQGITTRVLPMTDAEVATIIDTVEHGELAFQDYFVRHRWQPTVRHLRYEGAQNATLSSAILSAFDTADAIIIAPSNPWLSLAPMLAIPALREQLVRLKARLPIIAVTPIVGGQALKGPAAKIMRELGYEVNHKTILDFYEHIINAFISDEQDPPLTHPTITTRTMNTVMLTPHDKINFAKNILRWITALE